MIWYSPHFTIMYLIPHRWSTHCWYAHHSYVSVCNILLLSKRYAVHGSCGVISLKARLERTIRSTKNINDISTRPYRSSILTLPAEIKLRPFLWSVSSSVAQQKHKQLRVWSASPTASVMSKYSTNAKSSVHAFQIRTLSWKRTKIRANLYTCYSALTITTLCLFVFSETNWVSTKLFSLILPLWMSSRIALKDILQSFNVKRALPLIKSVFKIIFWTPCDIALMIFSELLSITAFKIFTCIEIFCL